MIGRRPELFGRKRGALPRLRGRGEQGDLVSYVLFVVRALPNAIEDLSRQILQKRDILVLADFVSIGKR